MSNRNQAVKLFTFSALAFSLGYATPVLSHALDNL